MVDSRPLWLRSSSRCVWTPLASSAAHLDGSDSITGFYAECWPGGADQREYRKDSGNYISGGIGPERFEDVWWRPNPYYEYPFGIYGNVSLDGESMYSCYWHYYTENEGVDELVEDGTLVELHLGAREEVREAFREEYGIPEGFRYTQEEFRDSMSSWGNPDVS